ncbi:hypothetical protein V5799_015130, partial [Amblyomma americanum]
MGRSAQFSACIKLAAISRLVIPKAVIVEEDGSCFVNGYNKLHKQPFKTIASVTGLENVWRQLDGLNICAGVRSAYFLQHDPLASARVQAALAKASDKLKRRRASLHRYPLRSAGERRRCRACAVSYQATDRAYIYGPLSRALLSLAAVRAFFTTLIQVLPHA